MSKRLVVSYTSPYPFLSSPTFGLLLSGLHSQLPLRNLHWKPTSPLGSSTAIRTVQELHLKLKEFGVVQGEDAGEKAHLNVYFLADEVSEA